MTTCWGREGIVPLKQIEYGVHGDLCIVYPKPYFIYLRGTMSFFNFGCLLLAVAKSFESLKNATLSLASVQSTLESFPKRRDRKHRSQYTLVTTAKCGVCLLYAFRYGKTSGGVVQSSFILNWVLAKCLRKAFARTACLTMVHQN